jgi:antitoxin component of MazEF toxin-antitoxin module
METESRVTRYGNALAVHLPVGVARELDLRDEDRVNLRTVDGRLIIERPKLSRLAARLATVRDVDPEIDTGAPIGSESFD